MATKYLQIQFTGVTQVYDPPTDTWVNVGTGPDFATIAPLTLDGTVWQLAPITILDNTGNFVTQFQVLGFIYDDSNEAALLSATSTITGVSYLSYPITWTPAS